MSATSTRRSGRSSAASGAGAETDDPDAGWPSALNDSRFAGPSAREPHWLEILLWGLCIFLLASPFTFTLTGQDPTVVVVRNIANMRQEENSQWLLYAVRIGVTGIAVLGMLPRWREATRGLRQLAPLMPFAIWALLSVAWSDDASTTLHSVASLYALILASYCIALRLPPRHLARAAIVGGVLMGLTSLGYALLLPAHGVHQSNDAAQYVHAGAWRGVFQHKNFLGQLSAFFAIAIFWAGRETIPSKAIKWILFGLMIFLTVMSTSASALAIIPLGIALVWATMVAGPKTRFYTLLYTVPALAVGYYALNLVLSALGRDATFSGRTVVWPVALESFAEAPLTGFGYVSITFGDFSYELMRRTGLFDPHSAFLDVALGLGIIGLLLFLAMLALAWWAGQRQYAAGGGNRQAALVLHSLMIGWLLSGITESADRPFTAMGGIGLFAVVALLALPQRAPSRMGGGRSRERVRA